MNPYIGIFRRCEMNYIRNAMEKYGLIPLEGKLLILLRDCCCTQEELGTRLSMDKGRIAKAVSLLEKKNLICRTVNTENRRQKLVSLTEEGRIMLKNIDTIYDTWDDICYEGFSEDEKDTHRDHIKRIAENAMRYRHNKT